MKATIEEILEDYKQGKMIILMDDEDREIVPKKTLISWQLMVVA